MSRILLSTDDPGGREQILETITARPQHVIVAACEWLGKYDAAAAGRAVAPSLYIAADEGSPRSDMARVEALLPGMQFGKTVGSGHFCQLEVPEQVNAMIDRFLAVTVLKAATDPARGARRVG